MITFQTGPLMKGFLNYLFFYYNWLHFMGKDSDSWTLQTANRVLCLPLFNFVYVNLIF